MRIYPLYSVPKLAAMCLADVHLRPSIMACAKFLSDAIHRVAPKDTITELFDPLGNKLYSLKAKPAAPTVTLMPPSKTNNPWVEWLTKNRFNVWWLTDYSFQINREYVERFTKNVQTGNLDEYMQIQDWVCGQAVDLFPQPQRFSRDSKVYDEFPLHLPTEEIAKICTATGATDITEIYRAFYAAQKGKIRYKWTGRPAPRFILSTDDLKDSSPDVPF